MRIALLILQLLPYALQAVKAVEESLAASKGEAKKAVVMSTVTAARQMGQIVPEDHVKALSAAIDSIVAVLNENGVFNHTGQQIPPPVVVVGGIRV